MHEKLSLIPTMTARNETDDHDCHGTCCGRGNTDGNSLATMVSAEALTVIL